MCQYVDCGGSAPNRTSAVRWSRARPTPPQVLCQQCARTRISIPVATTAAVARIPTPSATVLPIVMVPPVTLISGWRGQGVSPSDRHEPLQLLDPIPDNNDLRASGHLRVIDVLEHQEAAV